MSRIVVNKAPALVPVAYLCKRYGHVYIPNKKAVGGGCWSAATGKFVTASYDHNVFHNTAYYEPLYAGTTIEIHAPPVTHTLE